MPNPDPVELNPRQRAFVDHYVKLRQGAEAARQAGYSEDAAKQVAYKLLQRSDIQAAIREHEEADEALRGEVARKIRNGLWEVAARGKALEPIYNKTGKRVAARMVDAQAALGAYKELAKLEGLYPREGLDVRVQGELEKTIEGARPLMSPAAYAELVRALAEITGVTRMDPETAAGDGSDAVH